MKLTKLIFLSVIFNALLQYSKAQTIHIIKSDSVQKHLGQPVKTIAPKQEETSKNKKAVKDDCIAFFDSSLHVVAWNGGFDIIAQMRYMSDSHSKFTLLHFANQSKAENAVRIMQHYNINNVCYFNRPHAPITWYTSGNVIPTAACTGEDCSEFNPRNLQVRRINTKWGMCDGTHQMMEVRSEQEGWDMIKLIREKGFTHFCFFERGDASFIYMRK